MLEPLTFTLAGEGDADAVFPLLATQLHEHDVAIGAAALRSALVGLVTHPERGAVLLAREGSRAVGIAVLAYTWTVEHGGKVAWLDELYVVPERRSSGLGTRLLREAMDHARRHGCMAIDLEVDADHARVEALYLRHGFAALPRRRFACRL
ncbi:MAG: GNAT family N-acetyltransferase [Deltaproteobacteria bacterium]|nr:GNAT family N-acetyltransferase [Deltaproteobacteria bacterium]